MNWWFGCWDFAQDIGGKEGRDEIEVLDNRPDRWGVVDPTMGLRRKSLPTTSRRG